MRIEQLEYVLAVAHYGSLSRASEAIFIGQPTLSSAISTLENELGNPLFRRTRRGMNLTQLGQDLLPLIEKTVDDFYAIKKRAGTGRPTLTHLHLMTAAPTRNVMCDAISRSQNIFPTVHFYLHQRVSSNIMRSVADNTASIGLSVALDYQLQRHQEYAKNIGMRCMPMFNDRLILVCKSGGRFSELKECSFEQLTEFTPIALPNDVVQPGAVKVSSFWSGIKGHLAFDDTSSLYHFISQNDCLGITTLLNTLNDPLFTNGYFRTIDLLNCPVNVVHYLTYHREHSITDEEADLIQQIEAIYERLA